MSVFGPAPRSVLGSVFPAQRFFPRSLFAAGEVGAWYDPSDLTTLFQDTAGTTPVTTAGQRVALMRDKSGRGNHATQSVLAQRPTYAVEPATGRRNLLTYSEQFSSTSAFVTQTNVTTTDNAAVAPNGTTTAATLVNNTTNGQHRIYQNSVSWPTDVATCSLYAKADTASFVQILFTSGGANIFASFNLSTGEVATTGASTVASITSAGSGWYRCIITSTVSGAIGNLSIGVYETNPVAPLPVYVGTVKGILIWGAQLETGSAATAYQRVVTAQDVSEAGIAPRHYLFFDGIDDGMLTGTITPNADKVSVFAGVRKLSDAARGIVAEFSASAGNVGTFGLEAPRALTQYMFASGGSIAFRESQSGNIYPAPHSAIITGVGDISGDISRVRVNATEGSLMVFDQGTGNYLAYPLYLGRRGGTTLPFNGHIYGLIVRFSAANLGAAQIAATERWMNSKTGAF